MLFECENEGKVWKSCTSYATILVITVRVLRSLLYFNKCLLEIDIRLSTGFDTDKLEVINDFR